MHKRIFATILIPLHATVYSLSAWSANVRRVNSPSTSTLPTLSRLLATLIVGGILCALALSPIALAGGWLVNSSAETMNSNVEDMSENQKLPLTTTITDRNGKPLAYIYDQRRYEVTSDEISQEMKDSIVAIEDRRFYEHNGVDLRGTARAAVSNLTSGGVAEGASTLNQQYVKNYLYLIEADSPDEREAAIETSIPRKLREMRMASDLNDQLSKDEILTRYLNLVSYGHGAYGIEAAARTYFNTHASKLNAAQSAFLAGVVQSTTTLDPYTNPEAAKARRDTVLQSRVTAGTLTQAQADAAAAEPLGVGKSPHGEANGCIGAGNAGFFCDYVLEWLQGKGMSMDDIAGGGYTIKTTLDPQAQEAAHNAATQHVDPQAAGVSQAINFIAPRDKSHEVVAMASSRTYGLDSDKMETVNPVTHSLQGHGAGSIFKLFPAALAIEDGMGLDTVLDVPNRVEVDGLGDGGADDCPPGKYCVENSADYKPTMTLREALSTSPNTPFISMLEDVGVKRTMDLAVKLGLRSYEDEGTQDADNSIADYVKEANLGSFVLGPTPVNPLELSNVAASLADNGRWCEPRPVLNVKDRDGKKLDIKPSACEQALDPEIAHALANGMGGDSTGGTAANAAASSGWSGPIAAKTGTTETSFSSAFLGFTPGWAGSSYIFNDGGTPANLCTAPVRQCGEGNLYGGNEPAQTFFTASNAVIGNYGGPGLPPYNQKYNRGTNPPPSAAPAAISAPTQSNQAPSTPRSPTQPAAPNVPDLNQLQRDAESFFNELNGALQRAR